MDYSLKGKRVCLIEMSDEYSKLEYGDWGTIKYTDDTGTIHVNWDRGSSLALIPEVDKYRIIDE